MPFLILLSLSLSGKGRKPDDIVRRREINRDPVLWLFILVLTWDRKGGKERRSMGREEKRKRTMARDMVKPEVKRGGIQINI